MMEWSHSTSTSSLLYLSPPVFSRLLANQPTHVVAQSFWCMETAFSCVVFDAKIFVTHKFRLNGVILSLLLMV